MKTIVPPTDDIVDVQSRAIDIAKRQLSAQEAMSLLSYGNGDENLYRAAHPGYPGNFTRDGIISALLGGDKAALRAQLAYSAIHQGKFPNPVTGEEKGKIHHELPTVEINGASSAYNACDTTALFLNGISVLAEREEPELLDLYSGQIGEAISYIQRHTVGSIFTEDPTFSGAKKFGLKVTYWKDSILNNNTRDEPDYPIVYSLAHFQNASALLQMATLLDDKQLKRQADEMFKVGIERLWRGDHFVTAIDASGDIDPPSSDSLMCLLYISPDMIHHDVALKIETYMKVLVTAAGYRSGLPVMPGKNNYHTGYVWTHEQALLHAAAQKHGLNEAKIISKQVFSYLNGGFPELLDAETFQPAGNDPQLWTVQAYLYFLNPEKAFL